MLQRDHQCLPQEALKLIACVTMFIDHFGVAIVPQLPTPHILTLYYILRTIGRIAFPIYCFLLVEGMRHTRNPSKYILRLAIGIPLAELPFDYLFEGMFTWKYQNVMVTLTLGAIMLLCMQKAQNQWLKVLLPLPFAVLAELCNCDYGGCGIGIIAVFALFDRLSFQAIGVLLFNWAMNSAIIPVLNIPVQLFAVLAMIPIAYYSGVKLTHSKAIQWGYYLFYPMHMVFLWLLRWILW